MNHPPHRHKFRMVAGATSVPLAMIMALVSFYFMKWSTDVLLIAPAVIGAILAVGTFWDGLSDPIVAAYSDQRRSQSGRRKPVMRIGVVLFAIGAMLMWVVPEQVQGMWTIIWVLFGVMLYQTGHTMFWVPLGALGLEVFSTKRRRLLLQLAVTIPGVIVTVISLIGLNVLLTSETPKAVIIWLIGVPVLAFAIIAWAGMRYLPEVRSDHHAREVSVWRMIRDVLGNPFHRSILLIQATQAMAATSIILATPYILDVFFNAEHLLPLVLVTYFGFFVLFQPFHYSNAKRFGLVWTWKLGILLWALAFVMIASLSFLPPHIGILALFSIAAFSGVSQGSGVVIYPIIGDLADYDSDISGQRREGLYVTVFRLVEKSIIAIVTFAFGLGLQFSGYDPKLATQPDSVNGAIIVISSIIPFCLTLGGLWWLSRWSFYASIGKSDRLETPVIPDKLALTPETT